MKSPAEPTTAGLARQKRYGPFARGGTIWETASRKYTAPGELKGEQWHLGWEDTINDAAGFRNSTESPRCASAFRCASVGLNHNFRWAALVPSLPKTPCSSTQTPVSRRSLPDGCSRHANCAMTVHFSDILLPPLFPAEIRTAVTKSEHRSRHPRTGVTTR